MYKWQNKIEKNIKKMDPEISRGTRKLTKTPQLLKKIVFKKIKKINFS